MADNKTTINFDYKFAEGLATEVLYEIAEFGASQFLLSHCIKRIGSVLNMPIHQRSESNHSHGILFTCGLPECDGKVFLKLRETPRCHRCLHVSFYVCYWPVELRRSENHIEGCLFESRVYLHERPQEISGLKGALLAMNSAIEECDNCALVSPDNRFRSIFRAGKSLSNLETALKSHYPDLTTFDMAFFSLGLNLLPKSLLVAAVPIEQRIFLVQLRKPKSYCNIQ